MKITSARADRFVRSSDPEVRNVLFYGPDSGLVRERAQSLIKNFVGSLDNPFNNIEISSTDLKDDSARLIDESSSFSFFGGKRGIYVRVATDANAPSILPILDLAPGDTLIAIEAGSLGPRSKLRLAFEKSDNGAAVPCYLDDNQTLEKVILETFSARKISVSRDALRYLKTQLGSDRLITRSELEKLAVFKGEQGEISLEEARLCIGDSSEATLDDLVFAAASGHPGQTGKLLDRALLEGTHEIGIIRALIRHFIRLHQAKGLISEGATHIQAPRMLRPPIFFKQAENFQRQLQAWTFSKIDRAISLLTDTEIECKSSGQPTDLICRQAVFRICALGGSLHR